MKLESKAYFGVEIGATSMSRMTTMPFRDLGRDSTLVGIHQGFYGAMATETVSVISHGNSG